jgi:hypothetical protein
VPLNSAAFTIFRLSPLQHNHLKIRSNLTQPTSLATDLVDAEYYDTAVGRPKPPALVLTI